MKSEVLLVTGSRAFAGHPAALRWVRATLLREFASVLERTDRLRVVTGDADGVDLAALQIARMFHDLRGVFDVEYSAFQLDGVMFSSDLPVERWTEIVPPTEASERKKWPLIRNRAMVERVAAFKGAKAGVAIMAPWSTSHGAGQTVGLLQAAKIDVRGHTCPEGLRGKR